MQSAETASSRPAIPAPLQPLDFPAGTAMIQSQSSLVVPMLDPEAIECLEGKLVTETEEFDPEVFNFTAIAKTVLQFAQPHNLELNAPLPPLTEPVVAAMQRLVAIVAKLRSPQSGWPADLEPTVENLMPYVTEEAYEVLEALQINSVGATSEPEVSGTTASLPNYLLVEDLIPQLLWYIAKSSYDLMRLLCGVEAKVFQPGQGWQSGILRLVPLLTIQLPQAEWALDLATHQPPTHHLTHQALIQTERENFCQQPTWTQLFNQQLLQQMQTVTPELQRFTHPAAVDCLQPGQAWQSGTSQLQFAFAFVEETSTADLTPPNGISAFGMALKVKLIEPAIAQAYFQTQLQSLRIAIAQTEAPVADSAAHDYAVLLPKVVATAEVIAQTIPNAAELLQTDPPHPEICVEIWLPELLWQITCCSYPIMHLIGGIPSEVLEPGNQWCTGILRLFVGLEMTTTHGSWLFDLSTGQALNSQPPTLTAATLIRTPAALGEPGLQAAAAVLSQLMRSLTDNAPLLQALLQGTSILLQAPISHEWSTGHLQLHIGLELIPD
ncbi:MAG TPA: hypothetical protein V6C63_04740 [Allocoleopsis sp.]